jgi:hypothetical protein
MFASEEDASVMKIDGGGELGGREQGAARSNDGDENLWHEKLHERRVHHQSGKKRKRPFTGDESFNGGNGGNRGGGFGG